MLGHLVQSARGGCYRLSIGAGVLLLLGSMLGSSGVPSGVLLLFFWVLLVFFWVLLVFFCAMLGGAAVFFSFGFLWFSYSFLIVFLKFSSFLTVFL